MKVVLLCGGKGTRLSEHTQEIPKPLIEIGDKPILHHLMDMYAHFGFTDFVLCLGYKGSKIEQHFKGIKKWNIEFVHTGENANKAERLLKVRDKVGDTFLVSYGDDLSDVDINKLLEYHKEKGKMVTLTAVPLVSPFGILETNREGGVVAFKEKPKLTEIMNGGFYVMNKKVFDHMEPGFDLEKETFEKLANEGQIAAFTHDGFWKSMNTLKDVNELNELYKKGETPWMR